MFLTDYNKAFDSYCGKCSESASIKSSCENCSEKQESQNPHEKYISTGQETTVWTEHDERDSRLAKECNKSIYSLPFFEECGLDGHGFKMEGRNISNVHYVEDTILVECKCSVPSSNKNQGAQ